jgi:YfiH family protein
MTITLPAFEEGGVRHFFGTRGTPATPRRATVVSVEQMHGTDALVVDRPVKPGAIFPGGWDALVTNQPDVLLTVRTADCVPVLIHDPARRVVAAVHAGWRGTVGGIVSNTLMLLQRRFSSDAASLRIGIGPSIGVCCYEVDRPVLDRLRACRPDWRMVVRKSQPGRAMLDLRDLIRRQLRSAGVGEDRIHTVSLCTACHPELFYSYRREGTVNGTMVSAIMLVKDK